MSVLPELNWWNGAGHAVIWWSVWLLCKGFNYFLHLSAQEHHASGKILRRLKALKKAHLNKGGLTWHCSYLILYCPAMWLQGYWGAAFLLPGAQIMLFLSSFRIRCFVEHTMKKKQRGSILFTARLLHTVTFPRYSDKLTGWRMNQRQSLQSAFGLLPESRRATLLRSAIQN